VRQVVEQGPLRLPIPAELSGEKGKKGGKEKIVHPSKISSKPRRKPGTVSPNAKDLVSF